MKLLVLKDKLTVAEGKYTGHRLHVILPISTICY